MGYSLSDVAWLLGYKDYSRIIKWEKGTAMPNVENLLRLSKLYHTIANELYYDLSLEMEESLRQQEKTLRKRKGPFNNNSPN